MKPQKQKNRHRPEEGIYGDCHRTCIAMLLNMDRDDVPNFAEVFPDDGKSFRDICEEWTRAHGFATVSIPFPNSFEEVGRFMRVVNPGVYYLLGGESRSGVNHSVVAVNDVIACDPSLNDSGIIGPCNDGFTWVTIFVPIAMTLEGSQEHDPDYVGLKEPADG
jgi:hypothetical protein